MQGETDLYIMTAYWVLPLVLTAGGVIYWGSFRSAVKTDGEQNLSQSQLRSLARFFHERVTHFKFQIQTLDEHSNEYNSLFKSDEWLSLSQTIAHLEQMDAQIQGLIVTKRYQRASALLKDLYDPKKDSLSSLEGDIARFKANADWETNIRSLLKQVVKNLEAASCEVKKLGDPQKTRKRKPTLVTLADVKKSLLEDEAISRDGQYLS